MEATLTEAEVLRWLGPATRDRLHRDGLHPWHGCGRFSGMLVYGTHEVKKALARTGTGRGRSKGGPLAEASGRGGGYRVAVDGRPTNHPGGTATTATAAEGREACSGCHGSGNCLVCAGSGERSFGPCLVCGGAGECPLCNGVGFRGRRAGAWLGTGRDAATVTATGRQVSPRVEHAFKRLMARVEAVIGPR
jgi:hypothetical protein